MSYDFTPTTAQVEDFWASDGKYQPAAKSYELEESRAEFRRWFAGYVTVAEADRRGEVKWDEGWREGYLAGVTDADNCWRAEA